jgi:RsiW-degrading membrane proteinase PrsW (M82 family)
MRPVLLMLAVFVWLDAFKLMTAWETLGLLMLGGAAAVAVYPVAGRLIDALPLGFSFYSRVIAPPVEELIKGLVIIGLFRLNRIGFKLDAVISGFAVGAGFSVVENILYLLRFPDLQPSVWMVRGLGTAVMHGTTLAIMAAIAHELSEKATRARASTFRFRLWWFLPGYMAATGLHLLFNQFPGQPLIAMVTTLALAPLIIMALFKFGTTEAEHWLITERADHAAALDALNAGLFPADPSGHRLRTLAGRSGPAGERIREFAMAQLALIVLAEETLAAQALDDDRVEADASAAFARLDAARRALGPTLVEAVQPLLPLSRNDHWEISELKERVKSRTA